jgi:AcrR family transcriptional regulator
VSVQRRKAERPKEILSAAFEEFSKNGFAATRLDDIAARANVTKGTIYVYFSNKEVLFETMVQELMAPVIEEVDKLLSLEATTPEEVLRAFLEFTYDTIARDRRKRELIRLLLLESERFPDLTREHYSLFVCPMMDKFKSLMEELCSKGQIRDLPALQMPQLFLGSAMSLTIWRLLFTSAPEMDTDSHMEAILDLYLSGLLPGTDTGGRHD